MSDEECDCPEPEAGAPGWIVTFADLMSLLLTFFILLLSFAEMNVKRFKKAVGSIKDAFGVQTIALLDQTITSNNPFKDQFAKGALEWHDWEESPPKLAAKMEDFCELERNQAIKEQEEKRYLKALLEKKIRQIIDDPTEPIQIVVGQNKLLVRINQDYFFVPRSENIRKNRLGKVKDVFGVIMNEGASVTLTNYSQPLESSNYNQWRLSSNRSTLLAYLFAKTSSEAAKRVLVKSVPMQEKTKGSDSEAIDMVLHFPR